MLSGKICSAFSSLVTDMFVKIKILETYNVSKPDKVSVFFSKLINLEHFKLPWWVGVKLSSIFQLPYHLANRLGVASPAQCIQGSPVHGLATPSVASTRTWGK